MAGKVKSTSTDLTRKGLRSPYVDITVSDYGRIRAELQVDREKPRGGFENIFMTFELEEYNLECIGRQAISALRKLRKVNDEATRRKIENATGWAEGAARD